MSSQMASNQPSSSKNHIQTIAIVGATGQMGKHIIRGLLKNNKHQITALHRAGSNTDFPPSVKGALIDYSDPTTIVSALQGIDALVITMSVTAPPDQQSILIRAAAQAGVKWIMPNEWGVGKDEKLGKDIFIGPKLAGYRKEIEDLGVSSWVGVACGFWYEYSLGAGINFYGFDFGNREVVFFDEGEEKISTSTWPLAGQAAANLLGLKILPDAPGAGNGEGDGDVTLSQFRNRHVHVSSFEVSQKDIFESVKRVTGTTEGDWNIRHEDSKTRYEGAVKAMQGGDRMGFGRAMYTRVFYPTGEGNHEAKSDNWLLQPLPKENLDDYTRLGIERFEAGGAGGSVAKD